MRPHRRHLTTAALAAAIMASVLTPGIATAGTERPAPTPAATAAASSAADRAVAAALTQVGVPYVWGGETPGGFDCSGLMQWAYARAGVSLPRQSKSQATVGRSVSRSDIQPGDLLFYNYGKGVSHVAMAIGGGRLIEAPQPGSRVSTRALYTRNLAAIRRVG